MSEGLIHAYILDGKGGGKKVDWNEIEHWKPDQGDLWIHLDYQGADAKNWLVEKGQLDEITAQSLLAEETRPRCARMESGLQINLRGVNTNPGSEPEDMVSIRIFSDGQRLISTRKRRLLSIGDMVSALDQGQGPKNLGELLSLLTLRLTERMSEVITGLDDVIDETEDEIIGSSGQAQRGRIVELRRQVIMLRRYLSPQREALSRLQSENASWISDQNRMEIRESTDRLARYIEDLDSCRDRAAVVSEELSSRLSEQLNSRMYVLSIVAALFLPLGFLTGLFGINVGGIPLADNPYGFIGISLIMLTIIVLQIIIFRIKKWF